MFKDMLVKFYEKGEFIPEEFWDFNGFGCEVLPHDPTEEIEPDIMITTYEPTKKNTLDHQNSLVFEIHRLSTGVSKFFTTTTEDDTNEPEVLWRAAREMEHIHGFSLLNENVTINDENYFWNSGEDQVRLWENPAMTYRDLKNWILEMSNQELDQEVTIKIQGVEYIVMEFAEFPNVMIAEES
jgi:hypothetical protein